MNSVVVQTIIERQGGKFGFSRWLGNDNILTRLQDFAPIHVILLDLMFPLEKMTGYEVFDIIHQQPAFAHIPVAAISAADPSTEMTKARAKGFSGYIAKPIHLVHFPTQIAALIAGEMVWDAD